MPTVVPLLAAAPNRTLAIVLSAGLACLLVGLAVLMWTRWGQARPLTKCAGLSLFAHLLLLVSAYSTRVIFGPAGNPESEVMQVRLLDSSDDEDASPWLDAEADAGAFQPFSEAMPDFSDLADASLEGSDKDAATEPALNDLSQAPPLLDPPDDPPAENEKPAADDLAQSPPPENEPEQAEPAEPEATDRMDAVASDPPPSDSTNPPADLVLPDQLLPLPAPEQDITQTGPPEAADRSAEPFEPLPPPIVADSPPRDYVSVPQQATMPRRRGDGQTVPRVLAARLAADRLKVAEQHGGNANTEAAVAAALKWLATHQSADGRWDADAYGAGRETAYLGHNRGGAGARGDTGITGLALLALLGNGNTHLEGPYRENVQHGLEFILASQAANGSLAGEAELFASMYCHGIAALAISEAFAMTGDPRLESGVRRAIQYTLDAQHLGGGWRYQPGDAGDMSQFGWQLMALKSAELAGLTIPAESQTRAVRFLRSVAAGRNRGLACYRPGERPSRTMTAEAMYCRSLLNIDNGPAPMDEGARFVLEELPGSTTTNVYYWYYGTLAMFQRHGDDWNQWNQAIQRELLRLQRQDGDRMGSWDPDTNWGSYGGRVYSTAMGALCLEVYYRYLPLYDGQLVDPDRWAKRLQGTTIPR